MQKRIRIATRESKLAMWQANYIKAELERFYPNVSVEIIGMTTVGDKILDVSLAKIGGKALFVKELEHALLNNEADIAVHSMKDVPPVLPDGLVLPVICKRHDLRDAFVSEKYSSINELPQGAKVGTSSLRRQSQFLALRPDCEILPLRGNVNTRLAKLAAGDYDAIILAAAGLKRLDLNDKIKAYFEPNDFIPAVAQGALGLECRADDLEMINRLAPLNDALTHISVSAERAFSQRIGGSCQVPIGGWAQIQGDELSLIGLVADPSGKEIFRQQSIGDIMHAQQLGEHLAEALLDSGADKILAALK